MNVYQLAGAFFQSINSCVSPVSREQAALLSYVRKEFDFSADLSRTSDITLERILEHASCKHSIEEAGSQVAAYLEAEFVQVLKVPRSLLFSRDEKEISSLLKSGFLIQKNEITNKTAIITADPKKLVEAKHQYKSGSVTFWLTTRGAFEQISERILSFKKFISRDEPVSRHWRKAFALCLLDALELGAAEVFFGIPDSGSYEFTVTGKKYGGAIDGSVRVQGLALLDKGHMDDISREIDIDESIHFSKTTFKKRDVLVCRWGEASASVTSIVDAAPQKKIRKSPPHILLVDDDRRFAELLGKGIIAKGFSVSIATSVNDALLYHLETTDDIDLVITDYHMPHAKGSDLVEILRAKKGDLPVLMLTSDEEIDTRVNMLSLGCDAVVSKGDDPRILFAWIFRLLEKHVRKHGVETVGDHQTIKAG